MNAKTRGEILGERQLPNQNLPGNLESKSYLPFADDPLKQHRYLCFAQNRYDGTGLSLEEREEELCEFRKIQDDFVQIPNALKDRFTRATASQSEIEQEQIRRQTAPEEPPVPENKPVPPPMRYEEDWAPAKLLCKRFGEKDPYQNSLVIIFFLHLVFYFGKLMCFI
jgi:hypothetical protein